MVGILQPLAQNFKVVKEDGTPTEYFIKWAQQKQIDIGQGITAEQALAIIEQYLADHQLQEGSGISISPSGNLSDAPTIAAEVQAILDQITNVHGSVLFRGAAGWEALAPGVSGQFLKTNGAGADPSWAAGGGGGGSVAWQLVDTAGNPISSGATWTYSGTPVPTVNIIGLASYNEVRIYSDGTTATTSNYRSVAVSVNNGASFYTTNGDYQIIKTDGTRVANVAMGGAGAASAGARYFDLFFPLTGPFPTSYGAQFSPRVFVASPLKINAVQVNNNGTGNINGGSIYVWVR